MNISIYIKEPLLNKVREKARRKGMSLSKFIEKTLEKVISEPVPSLPVDTLSRLKGIVGWGGDAVKDSEEYYE